MSEQKPEEKPRLKVNELAAVLGESAHVVRNWLRDFRQWVPVVKGGKNGYNEFPPDAVERMRLIRSLVRDRGYSTRQIAHYLAGGEVAAAAPADPVALAGEDVADLKRMVAELLEQQKKQMEFQRQLVDRLDERERRDQARDQALTQFLTERRELVEQQRQQQEQQLDQDPPRGLFAKIFRKRE